MVTNKTRKLVALVLDDDPRERAKLRLAVTDANHEVVTAASIEEAERKLNEENIDFCVFDFRLGKDKDSADDEEITSEGLIRDLRYLRPNIPIVLTSKSVEKEDLIRCFKSGADVFITKLPEGIVLRDSLEAARAVAYHNRTKEEAMLGLQKSFSDLFMHDAFRKRVEMIQKQILGNILIGGDAGTGKSTLAKQIATQFTKKNPIRFRAQYLYYDCMEHLDKTGERPLLELSDRLSQSRSSVFEQGRECVVILDNLHYLHRGHQEQLMQIFQSGEVTLRNGQTARIAEYKFIFVYRSYESSNFKRGFLNKISRHEIEMPTLVDLFTHFHQLTKFIVERMTRHIKHHRIVVKEVFSSELRQFVKSKPLSANLLSLERMLYDIVFKAIDDNETDLVSLPKNYTKTSSEFLLPDSDTLSQERAADRSEIESLMKRIVSGEDLPSAISHLKDIMFSAALERFGENRALICKHLHIQKTTYHEYKKNLKHKKK